MNLRRLGSLLVLFSLVLSLLFVPGAAAQESVTVTIFHTNDIHSRIEEGKYAGMGMAKIATLVSEADNALLLDAGDTLHGQTIATLVEGESVIRVMNAVGCSAMVPGNHDFNYGYERLVELAEMAEFPIICANVKKGEDYLFTPYIIEEVAGKKIGIFGLATPETLWKSHPDNTKGLTFIDPVEAAKAMVQELQGQVDLIVALAHLGQDPSTEVTSLKVAQEVPEINLIVDGHSHTPDSEVQSTDSTVIVSAGEYSKELGKVEVIFDDAGITIEAEIISKEDAADVAEKQEVVDLIEQIKSEQAVVLSEVVGETEVELIGERAFVRTGETNLGNLITDAMRYVSGADIALTNGGGIRASIDKGEITMGEIITVLPFGNYVVVKKVQGKDIIEALKHGISAWPESQGAFPHVSGLSYTIDLTSEERITNVKVNGEPIDEEAYYTVATNDFLAAGGDGYTVFTDAEHVAEFGGLDEILADYIRTQGTVSPEVEGRIIGVKDKYIVKPGDVLWRIGRKFNVEWEELAEFNQLENPHLIFPEQVILIP